MSRLEGVIYCIIHKLIPHNYPGSFRLQCVCNVSGIAMWKEKNAQSEHIIVSRVGLLKTSITMQPIKASVAKQK